MLACNLYLQPVFVFANTFVFVFAPWRKNTEEGRDAGGAELGRERGGRVEQVGQEEEEEEEEFEQVPPCRPPLFSSSSTILDTRPPPRSNIALRKLLINSAQPK